MEKIVKEFMKHPLSDADILRICDGKSKIILNSEIPKYKSIEGLVYPYNSCIILYDKKDGTPGHWSCITKQKGYYEFFCPYGMYPDEAIKYTGGKSNLLPLAAFTGERLLYNKIKLQKSSSNVSVCGRYVGMRILLKNMPLESYVGMLIKNKCYDSDFFITVLTLFCEN